MPSYLRVTGADGVEVKLRRIGLRVSDLDFRAIANEGERLARSFAPEKTGKLKRSIKANKSRSRATITAGNRRGGKAGVPYAAPINYGWNKRNIEPSNFLKRADLVLQRTVPVHLALQIKRIIRNQAIS